MTISTQNQLKAKNDYSAIDLFRIIAAVLVVMIHANTTKSNSFFNLFNYSFTSIAVPFFFLVSGFFFQRGLEKSRNKRTFILNYEKKLLILYLCWMIISLPILITGYTSLYSDKSLWYIVLIILRRVLLCGEGVFWYILVMAQAAIVIYLCARKRNDVLLVILIILGLILGLLYDNGDYITCPIITRINNGFYFVFSWSNNFIMKGIPFMGIGYLISKTWHKKSKITVLIATVLLAMASLCNVFLYKAGHSISGIYIIQSVSFFCISLNLTSRISAKASLIMREISSSIYFLHTFLLYHFIEVLWGKDLYILFKVVIAIALSISIYAIVKLILRRKDIKLLRILFNIKKI